MYKIVPAERQGLSKETITKNRCKPSKKWLTAVFGTPGETRTHYIPLRRRTLYPGEVRGHIHKLFSYTRLRDSNGSIVRRRSLYTTELQGRMESICVASDACMASRIRGGLSALLSGHGGSAENIVPVFGPAVNGKGLPHRRQPSVAHWMTRTRITFSSAVTSSRTD